MNVRRLIWGAGIVMLSAYALAASAPNRTLKICVAADAPAEIQAAAARIMAGVAASPLLSALAEGHPPAAPTDTKVLAAGPNDARAYSHLILIGLPSDPMIAQVWQREARVEADGLYLFGFGHLRGTLGYIESDRNPFLHSPAVGSTPFETEVITMTGTSPQGVALAADAFLKQGLVNGLVAAPGWQRTGTSLLDHDPLNAGFVLPAEVPLPANKGIALTQAGEDEYRGVLADTGVLPAEIWRVKVLVPGAWDGAGATRTVPQYLAGLHRRAYGNTLWCARFGSTAEATLAAPKIAAAAGLAAKGESWVGAGDPKDATATPITLWQNQAWVLMSTLPEALTAEFKRRAVQQ